MLEQKQEEILWLRLTSVTAFRWKGSSLSYTLHSTQRKSNKIPFPIDIKITGFGLCSLIRIGVHACPHSKDFETVCLDPVVGTWHFEAWQDSKLRKDMVETVDGASVPGNKTRLFVRNNPDARRPYPLSFGFLFRPGGATQEKERLNRKRIRSESNRR